MAANTTNPNGNTGLSINFLPNFYQTPANKKFLQATLDQLYQPGSVSKVNGYVGKQNAKAATGADVYVTAVDETRQNYQLDPCITIKDSIGNTTFFKDYIDYINQISVFGGNTKNHARLNKQEFYSWDPHMDWDKFVNFQNYYWLPYGPETIRIYGQEAAITSTYTVTVESELSNNEFLFTPNGFTRNPVLTLYRGHTYIFEINSTGNPFSIKTARSTGTADRYEISGIDNYGVEQGSITFTVPLDAPTLLYYQSETDLQLGGAFEILDITADTFINVTNELLGKKTYKLSNGTALSNGMKLSFGGNVTPAMYATGEFYVEGVGTAIKLVPANSLEIINLYTQEQTVPFDSDKFDSEPFSDATGFAGQADYFVINRASNDLNNWSRYNRWFHIDVINASSAFNNNIASINQDARAIRPIIEFNANLKLFNFGTQAIQDIDVIDDYTTDAFSVIEGSFGYNVDGIALTQGQYIIFTADTDPLVKNKIFKVEFLDFLHLNSGSKQIHLVEVATPSAGQTVVIKTGAHNQGKSYWFNGTSWVIGQQKIKINQPPLFDVVDSNGVSFGDTSVYNGSTFVGTTIFSYKTGTGVADATLGFPLSYRNISNIGDIVFNFTIATDTFQYKESTSLITTQVEVGYLVGQDYVGNTVYLNGWQTCTTPTVQAAVRIYSNSNLTNNFNIDIFDNINELSDLVVRVYVNGYRIDPSLWSVVDAPKYKQVVFKTAVLSSDIVTIRAFSAQPINTNGFYEIPVNLQNNPLNNVMGDFTLGEVTDHVLSIVDNLASNFVGAFPGPGNLRDLSNVTQYGTKFVQHSGPLSLAMYHITSETNNVVSSLEQSRDDYNSFKRNFIKTATNLGVDGDPVTLVNLILQKLNANKPNTAPYYFSDMIPYGAAITTNLTVVDYRIKTYPLSNNFTLSELSNKAVGIYLNGIQLVYGRDYTFNNQSMVVIDPSVGMHNNDIITTIEYDSTDGCFVPETPTKLGMWPAYVPQKYVDTTLVTPQAMIQGHDGSQTLAYGDFRDDLILELEKRIFNNIKVPYDANIFDISKIIPSYNRSNDYSLAEFNQVLAPSFYKWLALTGRDFTKPLSYDINNSFTYNYTESAAPNGSSVPGYWRGIYRWLLDTDRPNLCPWEMLGFSIMPSWWVGLYGPAPYTGDNLPMWQDINDGMVRQPGVPAVRLSNYAKPFLMEHIPVDSNGNLLSPLECGLAVGPITPNIDGSFIFGDVSPVEGAWRRSSHYSYSVILASMLLTPANTFGVLLDRSRIKRNLAGQLIYKDTGLRVRPADIILPSIYSSKTRIQTAGIANYVVNHILNFIFSNNVRAYNTYQSDLQTMETTLSYRVGAFTSQSQFNLLLDSKTPLSTGSVFIPQENYHVILNSSSPVKKLTYSGVIITKLQEGFEIKGYSNSQPYFTYYPYLQSGSAINVGGISDSYSEWTIDQQYTTGSIIKYGNSYYRVIATTTAGSTFDVTNFAALESLPIVGGTNAILRTMWDSTAPITVPYGTEFNSVQEVVDFLQGYGAYLKDQGFVFNSFNQKLGTVSNWDTSVQEFMFWTTQNWSVGEDKWENWSPDLEVTYGSIVRYNGDYYSALYNLQPSTEFDSEKYSKLNGLSNVGNSVISLSPGANGLSFTTNLTVVDDISNQFYEYEIVKVDGTPLAPLFLDSYREGNTVSYSPKTTDGIYGASFYLIQNEQIITIDNTTIFNDVVYNPESGYRQERIKVSGYVSVDWYGGLDIPGFIYDQASIQLWQPWQSYALGDIVNYQGYYYAADSALAGSQTFIATDWKQLDTKPQAQILPNWTNIATQFTDFYSLDVDSFSTEQQKLGQHLFGYQQRQYLNNIIQDNVSEFKFYQGMIRDKGTQNVLNRLFGVLTNLGEESLTFYEEWAVRLGQYGASRAFENIEFILDEAKFRLNPQGFQLGNTIDQGLLNTFIIQQLPSNVYLPPVGYNSKPWPILANYSPFLRDAGYVTATDVFLSLGYLSEITTYDIRTFTEGAYIWVAFEGPSWNVYRYTDIHLKLTNISFAKGVLTLTAENITNITVGSYIGLDQVSLLNGFYQVTSVTLNTITVSAPNITAFPTPFTQTNELVVYALLSQRTSSINTLDTVLTKKLNPSELIWTDDRGDGKWAVWKYNPVYAKINVNNSAPQNQLRFGQSIAMSTDGTLAAVGTSFGEVITYDKVGISLNWTQRQVIQPPYIAANAITLTIGTTTINSRIVIMPTASSNMVGSSIAGEGIPANTQITFVTPGVSIAISQAAFSSNVYSTYTISNNPNTSNTVASQIYISSDASWLATSSPLAGYAVTNYLGTYNSANVYGPGIIVSIGNSISNIAYYQALSVVPVSSNPSSHPAYWKPVYYVPVNNFGTWDPTVTYPANTLIVYESNVYQATTKVYGKVTIPVTNTTTGSYLLTTADTSVLAPNYEIVFSGTTFGGVTAGEIYYVGNIVSSTQFTITAVPSSTNYVPITTASGVMYVTQQAQLTPDSGNGQWTLVSNQAGQQGQGVVSLYEKDKNNIYQLVDTIVSPAVFSNDISSNEYFGSSVAFGTNELFIGAPGSNAVYNLIYNTVIQASSAYNPVGSINSTLTVTSTTGIRAGMYVIGTGFTSGQIVESVINSTTLLLSGSPDSAPSGIIKFAVVGWAYKLSSTITAPSDAYTNFGTEVKLSGDSSTLAVSGLYTSGTTTVAKINVYKNLVLNTIDNFTGFSITSVDFDLSYDGTYFVVGSSEASTSIHGQGTVTVYTYDSTTGSYNTITPESLIPHQPETNGQFGAKVSFMNDSDTIVVYSLYGDSLITTTFDNNSTTFDKDSTAFSVNQSNAGRVDVYDRYATSWVFSESLSKSNPVVKAGAFIPGNRYAILSIGNTDFTSIGASLNEVGVEFVATGSGTGTGTAAIPSGESVIADGYGTGIAVGNNNILIGAPEAIDRGLVSGIVYDYTKPVGSFTWSMIQTEIDKPDVKKLKKAFLYNKDSGELLTYVDVIDPAQGKIAGPAEEEIKYKAFYDPATYTVGDATVNVNSGTAWNANQVGTLWWDLRTAKFLNVYENDPVYRNTNWNTLAKGASIDIYEWVSYNQLPAVWDSLADTPTGNAAGISGTSLYGNTAYTVVQKYNTVTQSFKNTYYFWVKNKKFIPNVPGRNLAAADVANLIANPRGSGYTYLALTGLDSFSLVNAKQFLHETQVVLSVEYWLIDKTDQNVHSHWKIISEDPTTYIPPAIEAKWIDSLCGSDFAGRVVPDPKLPPKLRYGIENRPRQGMFVNRFEALKEFIDLTNQVLLQNQIVENINMDSLNSYDPVPNEILGLYDTTFDTDAELVYANVGNFAMPTLTLVDPSTTNGKIAQVIIQSSGKGYLVAPYVEVIGSGTGAVIKTIINSKGQITGVDIESAGEGYDSNTVFVVRSYSALVKNDSQSEGNWSIYSYDPTTKIWSRIITQAYDVRKFWNYADWYSTGFSQFTAADFSVATIVDLNSISVSIGEIVKVRTVNSGGWLLLEKYANSTSVDWTQSYSVIGIQNGTIQLSSSLYQTTGTQLGFDNSTFDTEGYDQYAAAELRIILTSLKNDIFVNTLTGSYLKLFFNSVRYAHSEQPYVDWIFKTSFVKAQHNVGGLDQPVTYRPDNLSNFEDFVNEVKPYRTNVREYIDDYTGTDLAQLPITDFDLQPIYENGSITTINAYVSSGSITTGDANIQNYPWKFWEENVGFNITDIILTNAGSNYVTEPQVVITSDSGSGATARAFITNGTVGRIVLLTPGSGYLSAPTITIDGGLALGGTAATASAIIGNGLIRSMQMGIKFDRVDQSYYITQLQKTEKFTGSGSRVQFPLIWGPDVRIGQSTVTVNGIPALRDGYVLNIVSSKANGYTQYSGTITFVTAPANKSSIVVTYNIDESLLSANDRIQYFYNPTSGMLGKDLSQLMTGIDYGGVIVDGLGFQVALGWDSLPYYSDTWDEYDDNYTDYKVVAGANEHAFTLPYVPSANTLLNIYKVEAGIANPVKIDALDFNGTSSATNKNAIMVTPVADGISATVTLPNTYTVNSGDTFIIRQSTSDGSIAPQSKDYDTSLDGGNFLSGVYATATGLLADDIIVDGDDLVTPTTSGAPEEVVPGQVVDTVAIKVFDKPGAGSASVKVDNYVANGSSTAFALTQQPNSTGAVIVKVDGNIKTLKTDYIVNYEKAEVVFNTTPTIGSEISLFSIGFSGANILDIDYFVGDGNTVEFITNTTWQTPTTSLIYVDGVVANATLFKTDNTYALPNAIGIRFGTAPMFGSVINYIIVSGSSQTFAITKVETIATNGNLTYTLQNTIGNALPNESNMIVRVDQSILTGPSNSYFTIGSNRLNYTIDSVKFVPYSVPITNIAVLVGDTILEQGKDYIVDLSGITVKINKSIYTQYSGQKLIVSITSGETYFYNPSSNTITFTHSYDNTHLVQVISSYQHDSLDIERTDVNVSTTATLTPNTPQFYSYQALTGGLIGLDRSVISDDYVWLVKNSTLLVPGIDYKVNDDHQSITMATDLVLNDQMTVITFGSIILTSGIAYMQFKDMLNRVSYKRLSLSKRTTLAQDLHWNDVSIVVEDASKFDVPNPASNKPGVLEIRGERIEYFQISGNTLSQLRRGTLGTGVNKVVTAGTYVQDIGTSETIPYNDTQVIEQITSDGTNIVDLPFVPNSVNDIEVFVGGYNDGAEWASGVTYSVGTIITVGSYTYRCISNHISGATFFSPVTTVTINGNIVTTVNTNIASSVVWKFFIGNIRLKKTGYTVFNINNAPYSPAGDVTFAPDFSVDGTTAKVTLTNLLTEGTQITVIKNTGTAWDSSIDILYDTGIIAEFLRAEPGIWYSAYEQTSTSGSTTIDSVDLTFDGDNLTFDQGTT